MRPGISSCSVMGQTNRRDGGCRQTIRWGTGSRKGDVSGGRWSGLQRDPAEQDKERGGREGGQQYAGQVARVGREGRLPARPVTAAEFTVTVAHRLNISRKFEQDQGESDGAAGTGP